MNVLLPKAQESLESLKAEPLMTLTVLGRNEDQLSIPVDPKANAGKHTSLRGCENDDQ
jgi:hypothetical protein